LSLNYSIAAADSGRHRAVGRQIREAGPGAFLYLPGKMALVEN
jgi:hypothetical protein